MSIQSGLRRKWYNVGGMRMHARVAYESAPRDAPAVVLVHGIVVSSRYMEPTIRHLAPSYPVYAPELPGWGYSSKPRHVLDISELADALLAWLDTAGIDRPVLLGNSVDCQIVAHSAMRYPDRLSAVILQGPTVDPAARTATRQLARLLMASPLERPSHAINMTLDSLQFGPRRTIRTFQYVLRDRIEAKLPRVQAPALVIRGSRDPIVPQRWAEKVARLLPRGRLVVIPGAPHTINYAAPLELARVVRPFIDEHLHKPELKERTV